MFWMNGRYSYYHSTQSLAYIIEFIYLKRQNVLDPYLRPLNSAVQWNNTLQIAVQAPLDAAFIYPGKLLMESREVERP